MNIFEVLEYGPIVASNDELGVLITVNGSYYNIWVGGMFSNWKNIDLRATNFGSNGLYGQDMAKVMDTAKQLLEETIDSSSDNENELELEANQ